MRNLNVGFITTCSGRWPRELPNQRNIEYANWIKENVPEVNLITLDNIAVSMEDVEVAAKEFKAKGIDLIVSVIGAFTGDNVSTYLGEELKVPIIIWAPYEPPFDGGRLMANALVAATMNAAAMHRLGLKNHFVYGSYCDERVAIEVKKYLNVYNTINKLKQTYLGLLGYRPTAFYSSTFDETLIRKIFGIKMEEFDLKVIFDKMDAVDISEIEKDMELISKDIKIENLPEGYLENHSKLYIALKDFIKEQAFSAASIKCWPEMGNLKTTPCAVLSRLADEGFTMGCESDLDATITMIAQNYLTNTPTFMADLININEEENSVTLWHCGQAASKLKASDANMEMSNHPLAGQGTAFYTTLKPGKVTVARFSNIDNQYKLFMVKGEAIPTKRVTKGVMVNVVIDTPVRETIYKIAEEGVPHHYSIVWEDVAEEMKLMCKILNIPVIEIG